jgi:hypothetical protein
VACITAFICILVLFVAYNFPSDPE